MTRLGIVLALWLVGAALLLRGSTKVRRTKSHRGAIEVVAGAGLLIATIIAGAHL